DEDDYTVIRGWNGTTAAIHSQNTPIQLYSTGQMYSAATSFTGSGFPDKAQDLSSFPFRDYHSIQGRWISPDPAGLAAVDITDPQTWNRYAYVRNTPTGLVDPTGLCGQGDYSYTDENGNVVFGVSVN